MSAGSLAAMELLQILALTLQEGDRLVGNVNRRRSADVNHLARGANCLGKALPYCGTYLATYIGVGLCAIDGERVTRNRRNGFDPHISGRLIWCREGLRPKMWPYRNSWELYRVLAKIVDIEGPSGYWRPMTMRYPPRTDATAEELAQALFVLPQDPEWQHENDGGTEYRCVGCGEAVHYPDTLTRAGLCAPCQEALPSLAGPGVWLKPDI